MSAVWTRAGILADLYRAKHLDGRLSDGETEVMRGRGAGVCVLRRERYYFGWNSAGRGENLDGQNLGRGLHQPATWKEVPRHSASGALAHWEEGCAACRWIDLLPQPQFLDLNDKIPNAGVVGTVSVQSWQGVVKRSWKVGGPNRSLTRKNLSIPWDQQKTRQSCREKNAE